MKMFMREWSNMHYRIILAITILNLSSTVRNEEGLHPLLFIHGFKGCQLKGQILQGANLPMVEQCRKGVGSMSFTIWESFKYELTHPLSCVYEALRAKYNNKTYIGENRPGVYITVQDFGTTKSFNYVIREELAGPYFIYIVKFFLEHGYSEKNIYGAPFDFRQAPRGLEEWFMKTKKLVEIAYKANGNQSVIIIPHSIGGTYINIFLLRQTQTWKDKYVTCVIFMAPSIGGGPTIIRDMFAGEGFYGVDKSIKSPPVRKVDLTCYLISKNKSEFIIPGSVLATYPATSLLLPSGITWDKSTTLLITDRKNYSISNYQQFFSDFKFYDLMQAYEDNREYINDGRFSNVPTHCVYGLSVPTIQTVLLKGDSPPYTVSQITGDGDGLVNERVVNICRRWMKESNGKNVTLKIFPGVNHDAILGNTTVLRYVQQIVDFYNKK